MKSSKYILLASVLYLSQSAFATTASTEGDLYNRVYSVSPKVGGLTTITAASVLHVLSTTPLTLEDAKSLWNTYMVKGTYDSATVPQMKATTLIDALFSTDQMPDTLREGVEARMLVLDAALEKKDGSYGRRELLRKFAHFVESNSHFFSAAEKEKIETVVKEYRIAFQSFHI